MNAKDQHLRQACRLPRTRRDNSSSSRLSYKHLAFGVGLALGSLLVCGVASAAAGVAAGQTPTGGKVVGGAGSITQHGAETIIKQQSKLLALDWQTFNVGKDASVLFKQPGVSAIALNRILDQNPSQIFGKINSNGQIFLINTHGIIFGASAQLNVGGLVASTLDLTPDDFLKQHFNLDAHGGHAGVVNHGTIAAASGGSVSLIGGSVENSGLIVADYGHINLDGADRAVLDFDGNGLVNVQITGALQQRFDAEKAAVSNTGKLKSAGGTVVLQASAAKDLFTDLVNNSGVIDAHGISTDGGVVRLVGTGGNTVSSGRIDVSGTRGGNVEVLSNQDVMLNAGTDIDASGSNGGGRVRIGGGYQGGEGLLHAQRTYVDADATVSADATARGNGGSVAVWSDHNTVSAGTLSARGGTRGGDGGLIETSSHGRLNVTRAADASAADGQAGTWLLDPNNIEIVATGSDDNITGSSPFKSTDDASKLTVGTLKTALTGGTDVKVQTMSAGANTEDGNITFTADLNYDGIGTGGSLTLDADNDIVINGSITDVTTATTDSLGLVLDAGGAVTFNNAVNVASLDVTSNGDITQGTAGTLDVSGASSFAAGTHAITLDNTGNHFTGAVSLTGDTTRITNAGALTLGTLDTGNLTVTSTGALNLGSGTVGGTLDATSNNGTIFQAGTLTVTGAASLDAGTGDITLTTAGNNFQDVVNLTGGTTQLVDTNALTLGTVATGAMTVSSDGALDLGTGTVTGNLSATSAGDGIGQSGTLTVTGTSAITATDGTVTLTDTGNDFQDDVTVSGEGVSLADTNNLSVTSLTDNANGNVSLIAEGQLSLPASIAAGTGNITLAANGGSLSTPVLTGTNIDLTGRDGIILNGNVTAIGTLALTSTNTAISQIGGGISANGATTVTAGTGVVTMTSVLNDFQGTVNLTGGAVQISDFNNLALGTLDTGNLAVTSGGALGLGSGTVTGNLSATSAGGGISQTDALTVTGTSTLAATGGAINLADTGNDFQSGVTASGDGVSLSDTNDLTVTLLTDNNNGDVSLIADGLLGLSQAINAGTGNITLAANGGSLSTLALTGTNIDLTGSDGISLGDNVTAAGTLNLASTNAAITQAGGTINATGITTANAGNGTITLTGVANDFVGAVGLTGGTTKINDQNALALGTLATGDLAITSSGALSLSGDGSINGALSAQSPTSITVDGDLTGLTGVTFSGASATGTGSLTGTGAVTGIGGITFNLTGNKTGTAGGITFTNFTSIDAATVTGASGFDDGNRSGEGITFGSATSVTGSGTISNVTGNFADDTGKSAASGISYTGFGTVAGTSSGSVTDVTGSFDDGAGQSSASGLKYTGFGAVTGTGGSVTGVTGSFDLGTQVSAATGIDYNGFNVTTLSGSGGGATIAGSGQTYTLDNTFADKGGSGGVSWTGFGNIDDTAGTISFGTASSLSGNATAATLDYGSYGGAVTFDLDDGSGATTGIGGTWTGVTSVSGSGNADTISGNSQSYNLTAANAGDNGTVNWTAFEKIADGGTGTINTTGGQSYTLTGVNAGTVTMLSGDFSGVGNLNDATGTVDFGTAGSVSGNVTAAALNYGSYGSAVSFDLSAGNGATTGIGGSWSGVTMVAGSGAGATIAGSSQTYNLTGANAGNNGTVNWTSFGNVADSGTGTIVASNQNWVLTGSGQGTVTNLSGSFAGIGNLADTGTGHFAMHSGADGSLSGSLDAGTGGTLDYTGYTTPVNVNLAGTGSTGIAGNLSGISTIVADSNLSVSGTTSDSLAISTGAGATTALGSLAVATGLAVNASGAVLQGSGPLTVGGTTSILAGGNAITLTNANNDFGGGVTVEGADIALTDSNDLNIASLTNSGNGDVSLIAGGALFGVGAIDAGAGDITLAANGGALNTAALTGGNIDLTGAGGIILGDNVTAGGALSLTSGSGISQNLGTVITADSLTGSSVGATTLEGNNAIATLGNFTADGFSLTSGQTLNVASGATVGGGSSTTLTTNGAGSDLTIDGTLQGTAIQLTSSGAIGEGSGGIVSTTTLTGSSAGDTTLAGSNQINTLGQFSAKNFTLINAAALTVQGPLITTGDISLTTTGPGNVLNVGQALTGGMISLNSAGDLSVVQAIQGTSVNLTANGNLAIDAVVNSGGGVTTLIQNGSAGTISQSSAGTITAGTLTGAAQGGVALTGANVIANLGDFTAEGFSLTNTGPLAVAAGSTLDGGDSTALKTTGSGGDLTINGSVAGTLTSLVSSGAINEGSQGTISAGILTGGAAHGAQLKGGNAINNLGNFTANGLTLNNGQALTVMAGVTVDGGASTALTVTGATGNLVINGTLKGATTTLQVSGAISEGAQGVLEAGTLTGKSAGSTSLTGNNDVDNLGDFTADGFALTTDPGLTVMDGKTVDGGSSVALTTTGTGNDIGIDGTVKGDLVTLVSSGAITEGANGLIQADGLTGSSVGDTQLTRTAIDALNAFKSKNFSLTNTKALAVGGPVTTTGNAGDISLATTGTGHALTVNQAVKGAAITLASAGDLTVANAVTGSAVNLAAAGNLVIDAAVDSAAGTTTLTQTGSGAITGGANGSISAATLAGTATGTTTLGSAGQFMANHVDTLGDFSSKAGFSLTNDGTLTLASVNGSAYTVDAGKSDFYLKVQNGDLLQNGTTWSYNGTGTWSAPDGHIGLANAPIYVTGANPQVVAAIGLPPAYFYAVDYNGNLLPLTGATSVNVPTSILSSRSQGVNGHADQYIDVGVITAVYRAYGVVPPGLLLPPDQRQCSPDQPPSEMCPDNN